MFSYSVPEDWMKEAPRWDDFHERNALEGKRAAFFFGESSSTDVGDPDGVFFAVAGGHD